MRNGKKWLKKKITLDSKIIINFISKCSAAEKREIEAKAAAASIKLTFESNKSITIEGINVKNVGTSISDYIDEKFVQHVDTAINIFPSYWEAQTETLELKALAQNSVEWNKVATRVKLTVPAAAILKIERAQNKFLWERYYREKKLMEQKNGTNIENELQLFHGTGTTSPTAVYSSEDGFDMRFGTGGMWGNGIYFAVNASYSYGGYIHKMSNGQKQLFLADVLVGDSYFCKSDGSIRKPPEKARTSNSGLNIQKLFYDSCSGETGNSKVYILYTHGRAYPTYLITFA